mmetsp:Transcript_33536/g.48650  ORF Transcript_33536/g.48650 Transcript_33536/m.48650 type:complete len:460 (+) Transcript_33536:14-1393(+)
MSKWNSIHVLKMTFLIIMALDGVHSLASPSLFSRSSRNLKKNLQLPVTLSTFPSTSLIPADANWSLWAFIASSAAFGLKLEKSTVIGRALSGPVCAMLISAFATNIGILPSTGSIHITNLQSFVVKLATPLLLLGADLQKIYKETKGLVKAFLVGSIGTTLGAILSFAIFHKQLDVVGIPGDGWKIAAALIAKNIGGGLNFMAVVDILKASPSAISAGLTVDNILGLLYFPIISSIGQRFNNQQLKSSTSAFIESLTAESNSITTGEGTIQSNSDQSDIAVVDNTLGSLAVGLSVVALSEALAVWSNIPALTISTALAVFLATVCSQPLTPLVPPAELLGKLLLLLFFGSIGCSAGNLGVALQSQGTLALLGFGIGLYLTHLIAIFVGGCWIMKISLPDVLLGSNANIGNAATASALASSLGWQNRLLPAVLVGTLGNVIGSFVGLWVGYQLLQPLARG